MVNCYRFGPFELRPFEGMLLKDGQAVRLGSRPLAVLHQLVANAGRVVTFDEFSNAVWARTVVEENNLSVQIAAVRKVVQRTWIQTVHGVGYRFIGPVTPVALTSSEGSESAHIAPTRPWDCRTTLAVMPLHCTDSNSQAMGIGDVITDQLTCLLSTSSWLKVISRISTNQLRHTTMPLAEIGSRLGTTFVVSGSCWTHNGRVTACVEVANAALGGVVGSKTVAEPIGAVLQQDSSLILTLAGSISHAIVAEEVRSGALQPFPDLSSHTLLLTAISLLYRLAPADFARAHQALEELRSRCPGHPMPLAWLARWHLFRVVQGWSDNREQDGLKALALAQQALDADPHCALALTMLGNVHTNYLRDLDTAENLYQRATHENPNESLAWLQWGNARSFRGDGLSALEFAERATRLSPLDPSRHYYDSLHASAALTAGHFDRAIQIAHRSLASNRQHVSTYRVLAIAQSLAGRLEDARTTVRRILEIEPDLTVSSFIARSPGLASGLAVRFGHALGDAGLPL